MLYTFLISIINFVVLKLIYESTASFLAVYRTKYFMFTDPNYINNRIQIFRQGITSDKFNLTKCPKEVKMLVTRRQCKWCL